MLTIHGVPFSVHTRKVILAAIEKKLAFRIEPVIPFHPPAGWSELSPTGKIPVVRDGDLVLRDSSAICAYLERIHPQPALYPAKAADYAQALWLQAYADGTLYREVMHGLLFEKVIRPNILKESADPAKVQAILEQALPRVFGYLETVAGAEVLVGAHFGIADIALVSNLINYHYLGYEIDRERFPRLRRYFHGHLDRACVARVLREEQPFAASMGLDTTFLDYAGLVAA
jgi:glutathione S-transferase